jgi:tagatose 1,6-diphosphate aldolase GatY/KbaY
MSFVTSKELLLAAKRGKYAVGAFNAENMEMVKAIIAGASAMRSPVIIQTTPSTLKYASPELFCSMVKEEAENADIPVVLHLDHGNSFELAEKALKAGYSSIMIDGSHEVFEDNIAITRRVVDLAAPVRIPVEAELGKVGGKEDDMSSEGGCTDTNEAVEFVARTGIDSLAVAIGTAHGIYKKEPHLDIELLKKLQQALDIPLVLHGASGLSDDCVRECVANGICKVNFATELRIAYTKGVKEYLNSDSSVFDPKKYGLSAMKKVETLVMEKIKICGCADKY